MVARIIVSDNKPDVGVIIQAIEVSGFKVVHKTGRSISLSPKSNMALSQFKEEIKDLVLLLKKEFKIENLSGYVPKSPTLF